MDNKLRSINEQIRKGTLARNNQIVKRVLFGFESQVAVAKDFGLTKQMVNKIVKRYLQDKRSE